MDHGPEETSSDRSNSPQGDSPWGLARLWSLVSGAMRVILTVLAVAVVVWSFWHAVSRPWRQAAPGPGVVEITVLHWGDRDEDQITQALVDSFEASHPNIRIRRINAEANYYAKLQTMIAAGDPPDLFFLNSNSVPKYVAAGILENIDPLIRRDIESGALPFDFADMYPQALDSFRFDGSATGTGPLYGLPMSFTPMGFYINLDLFKAAGVEAPKADWTWRDFEHASQRIREYAVSQGKADTVGAALDLRGGEIVRLILWTHGTDLITSDYRKVVRNPTADAVLEEISRWSAERTTIRVFGDPRNEVESGASLFLAGKAGMYGPIGRWMVPPFRAIRDFSWDYADLPIGGLAPSVDPPAPHTASNMLYVAAWCVSAGSKHKEEAWAAARHFATREGQRINTTLGLALPTLRSVAQSEVFSTPGQAPASNDAFLRAIPRSREMGWPANSQLFTALKVATERTMRTRTMSIESMRATIQSEFDRLNASPISRRGDTPIPWRTLVVAGLLAAIVALAVVIARLRRDGRIAGVGKLSAANERSGWLMISPWALSLAVLFAVPMGVSLVLAFSSWSGLSTIDKATYVGGANFREMFVNDPRFARSLWVTVFYAAIAVPLGQIAALAAAMLMAQPLRGINIFRTIWYLPTVLAGVAMAVMWWWVFDAEQGLVNMTLRPVLNGISALLRLSEPLRPPAWFTEDARVAGIPAFAFAGVWGMGGTMLVYLAGLLNIPRDLYEAAELDGAGGWARFRNVTLPMLSPVILFNAVIAIIGSFQVFTLGYVMTKGGPGDATLFYVLYLYEQAFEHHEMGYASAMAWVLFAIVLGLTLVMLRLSRSKVHYEGAPA